MYASELTEERLVGCPCCGEDFAAVIDCSAGDQDYVEDCPVCCRPILFRVRLSPDGSLSALALQREND